MEFDLVVIDYALDGKRVFRKTMPSAKAALGYVRRRVDWHIECGTEQRMRWTIYVKNHGDKHERALSTTTLNTREKGK